MTIWNKFTSWLSGWPEGTSENKKIKANEELFREEEIIKKRKTKKPKGLNPKKKKTRKQGNMK